MMTLLSVVLMLSGGVYLLLYREVERSADWLISALGLRKFISVQLQSEVLAQAGTTLIGFGAIAWWLA